MAGSSKRISGWKTPSQLRREKEMEKKEQLKLPENERLEVVKIQGKGRGVKARIEFNEGEFVCEYVGMVEYSSKKSLSLIKWKFANP